jgi:hypothetical protein
MDKKRNKKSIFEKWQEAQNQGPIFKGDSADVIKSRVPPPISEEEERAYDGPVPLAWLKMGITKLPKVALPFVAKPGTWQYRMAKEMTKQDEKR